MPADVPPFAAGGPQVPGGDVPAGEVPGGEIPAVEVSDPRFEVDGVRLLTVASPALGGRGDVSAYVPDGLALGTQVPLVVLLHGVYGSHWAWFGKGGAHRTARRLIADGTIRPMVLACPSDGLRGDGSGYADHAGGAFETWIMRDALGAVRAELGLRPGASPLFLAGLSMGGYGALRLGARHGAEVAGVSAHSSVTRFAEMAQFVRGPLPLPVEPPDDPDVLPLMERRRSDLPPVRFDCGTDDPLLPGNRLLHDGLEAAGIDHVYAEHPGGHAWEYWAAHVADSLAFFEAVLRGREARTG